MAQFTLICWPMLAVMLFSNVQAKTGLIAVVLLPYLFLPEAFTINLPGLPDLNKSVSISVGLILCLVVFRHRIQNALPQQTAPPLYPALKYILWGCFALIFVGSILTVLGNRETLQFGPRFIPSMRIWDAFSMTADICLTFIPFWCAARYFAHPEMHRILLKAMATAVLFYSLLMLIEIRLSPQLHNWVYGYHQHSFLQHIRDGFRPMVFLEHGIWVGFLVFMGVLATAGLWRVTREMKWLFALVWIVTILSLSENLAALAIGVMLLGAFFVFNTRLQRLLILGVAVAMMLFPALRQTQLVPTTAIVSAASLIDHDRARSLSFRLRNEDKLLARAGEKPLIGWGGWGRSEIYDDDGRDLSVAEGLWILTLSRSGWIGYVTRFGLLTIPLLVIALGRRLKEIPAETMALSLIATGNLIYMIPNATMTPVGLMVFGALTGFALYGPQARQEPQVKTSVRTPCGPRYTRFGPGAECPQARVRRPAPPLVRAAHQKP